MPIKKDGTGKRWVEMEFLAPGTPEQIWQAVATGPGNTAWFTRTQIEERVGGKLRFAFGEDMFSSGEVTTWEPPHRFGYVEKEWNGDAPPIATEITITSRSGGECLVRMVHSLFSSSDEWDDQMEGFESGWPGFFAVLRIYLQHFGGQKGASFQVMAKAEHDHLAVWMRLVDRLGLAGANVGELRALAGPEPLSGAVEQVHQDGKVRFVLLRLDQPGPGVGFVSTCRMGEAVNVSASLFFYGDDAETRVAASEPRWRDWFAQTFPAA
ncbi:SRPBCC domain-containing protein [Bosea sp. BK604]|uniref:SRPBCC family protein n=1 Tax=Bosea sp. BK604 TaxID=2512180 RepID=UPI00104A40E5|nr:SRPBCC domain-containing protein [Bosea sp. BK604]TCR70342.1 uncharacterized protein YndB with AHSA1/START domain [Bosea sp. BK604]